MNFLSFAVAVTLLGLAGANIVFMEVYSEEENHIGNALGLVTPKKLHEIKQLFYTISQLESDGNPDSFISRKEFIEYLISSVPKEKAETIPKFFEKIDTDHDGKLSLQEFARMWKRNWVDPSAGHEPVVTKESLINLAKQAHTVQLMKHGYHALDRLVLRRAQIYTMTLSDPAKVKLVVDGTDVLQVDAPQVTVHHWQCKQEGNKLTLAIPAKAEIGRFEMAFVGKLTQTMMITVLFNPWSKHDSVYYPNEADLSEYLRDTVLLWQDDWNNQTSFVWQTSHHALLDTVLDMFDTYMDHTSAVQYARKATWLINAGNGERGAVVVGSWSGDYSDGTNPEKWVNSKDIFDEWKQNYFRPVKYAQCWVYAALLSTAMRAVGIPCRPLTNYRSAHDIGPDYDFLVYKPHGDSVWNYHLWNEVWLKRPKSDSCKDGCWNAVDATPQEISGYRYQCGPVPVPELHKNNKVGVYDAAFVIGEVNAHVWTCGNAGPVPNLGWTKCLDIMDAGRVIATRSAKCEELSKKAKESGAKFNPTVDCLEDLKDSYKAHENVLRFKEDDRSFETKVDFVGGRGFKAKEIVVEVVQIKDVPHDGCGKVNIRCSSVTYDGKTNLGLVSEPISHAVQKFQKGSSWKYVIPIQKVYKFSGKSNNYECVVNLQKAKCRKEKVVHLKLKHDYDNEIAVTREPLAWEFNEPFQFNILQPRLHLQFEGEVVSPKDLKTWEVTAGQKIELKGLLANPFSDRVVHLKGGSMSSANFNRKFEFVGTISAGHKGDFAFPQFVLMSNDESDEKEEGAAAVEVTVFLDTDEFLDLKATARFHVKKAKSS